MTPPQAQSKTLRMARVIYVLFVIAGLSACSYGSYLLVSGDHPTMGIALVTAGVSAVLLGTMLYCQLVLLHKFVSYVVRAYEALLASAELIRQQELHTRSIAENSSLSEWAKRIVYREKDYEFLRDTIQGSIVRQDWEAAEHLIHDVEREFGYRDEAAHLREKLEQAKKATIEEHIESAVTRFDKLCGEHKWDQAQAECERLRAVYPNDARVAALSEEIERRRQEVKLNLLKEYDHAVRSNEVDRAHRLLFALDQYLMPQEAESIKESARTVFRARLEQIKTRFSIAVSYKQFYNAIAAGEQLIREFPNSGYAREISKLMPMLKERAQQQQTAAHADSPATAASH